MRAILVDDEPIMLKSFMRNSAEISELDVIAQFENAEDAMKWLIKIPTLAAFGGYDPDTMSEETIVEFANEILQQLKLVSYKYKK